MGERGDLFGNAIPTELRNTGLEAARSMLAMQGAALDAMMPLAHDWLHRRQEALAAARHLLDGLATASGPMDAMQAQQLWWSGVAQRMTQDAGACMELGAALMRVPGAGVAPEHMRRPARPRGMASTAR